MWRIANESPGRAVGEAVSPGLSMTGSSERAAFLEISVSVSVGDGAQGRPLSGASCRETQFSDRRLVSSSGRELWEGKG